MYTFKETLEKRSEKITESGCVIWTGAIELNGYGVITKNNKKLFVHRLAYTLHKGEIPANKHVLHSCDVSCCINPEHLRLGTPADNAKDREQRLRMKHVTGDANGKSKLTSAQVLAIKTRLLGTESYFRIARDYSVKAGTIQDIHNGRTWKEVKLS